jgi:hypothetical protein
MNRRVKQNAGVHFKSTSQTPSTNSTVRRISLLLTPQFSITSRHSATTLFQCSHGFPPPPPSIKNCLILQVSLDSNIHLCLTVQISCVELIRCLNYLPCFGSPPMMRHTSSTMAPPLQYAVQWVNGSCSLGDGGCPSLETAFKITLQDCQ